MLIKSPDIDLNFSGDYQPIIHAEVRRLFGEKNTFRMVPYQL
ncbi:hypothetical protein ONA00_00555 [Mycoplasmopsis cynos]|nr:hypothetical protein [Mycoplasmopsis cynos]WAM11024.1 hypothetical protein ONA00_00555 [Mycoplasmopsis cynos]